MPHPATDYDRAVKAVGREVGMRQSVYPKWVASGRMTQEKATEETEAMEEAYAILRNLQNLSREELNPQPELL